MLVCEDNEIRAEYFEFKIAVGRVLGEIMSIFSLCKNKQIGFFFICSEVPCCDLVQTFNVMSPPLVNAPVVFLKK